MREDPDFAHYVAARWPTLVRAAVALGCREDQASTVALEALAGCQRRWSQLREEPDVDAVVRQALVEAWNRLRVTPMPAAVPTGEPLLDADVAAGLDAMTPAARARRVLADDPRLVAAAARVSVLAPPSMEQLTNRRHELSRGRSRATVRMALATAVPLLLAAGGVTWLADRSPAPAAADDHLGPLAVVAAENPTNVVWEAGGVLHLAHRTVEVPPMLQLAPFGSGVLYVDDQDRVVRLDDDGTRAVLGHENVLTGFVDSDQQGWAAWVDPTGGSPELVVEDVVSGRVVGRLDLASDRHARPVAIDGDTVYVADDVGVRGWQPTQEARPAAVVEPADLVAAQARTRVYQSGAAQLQVMPYFGLDLPVTGVGGRLSADGTMLLTRTSGDAGGDGPIAIYLTGTGEALDTGVADNELAIDGVLGPDRTVTYLIARKSDRPTASDSLRASFAGAIQLRTCTLYLAASVPAACRLVTDIPVSGISPMLAH